MNTKITFSMIDSLKIQAIKSFRGVMGVSLKEAKGLMDKIQQDGSVLIDLSNAQRLALKQVGFQVFESPVAENLRNVVCGATAEGNTLLAQDLLRIYHKYFR